MLPSGTVTFLFTDVAGSTVRWQQDADRMAAALAEHNRLIEEAAAAHRGHVFKTVGDAYCIAFSSAHDAAAAALLAQTSLAGAADPLPVRMALHTAAIDPTGDDYFGAPLSRVARILAAAHGGQILAGEATRALLPSEVPARDLGRHLLRDLMEPERLWQIGPGEFGELTTLAAGRNNLPIQTTSFVGRIEELAELDQLLGRSRLVTVTGTGGTGKSRLALQYAADHLDRYPDGVWFCELAPLPEREDVLRTIAGAVSAPEIGSSLQERIVSHLSTKACLIVLDNCEHVLDAACRACDDILAACPSVSILATSREPLGARGEIPFRVPSLPAPDPALSLGLDDLCRYGSTALFLDRLAFSAPSYRVSSPEAATIAKICNRLDGIPLAIELAAARGRAMSLQQIEKRLDDRFRLLTGGSRNALSRQQTLRALIDWSVQLLDDRERRFFATLAVFGGGWNLEAAEAVCAGGESGFEAWEVLDLLTALVDKSLVVYEPAADRYRLLESVRQYALERLEQDPQVFALRDHYFEIADRLAMGAEGHAQVPDYRGFSLDYENFRMAVEWASGTEGGVQRAVRTLVNAWTGFHSLGRPGEFIRLMDRLLGDVGERIGPEELVNARLMRTLALVVANDPRGYDEALAMLDRLDSLEVAVRSRWRVTINYSLFCAREFERCVEFSHDAISRGDEPGNPWFSYFFVHLGNSLTCLGRYDEAISAYERAQEGHRERNDERGYIANLTNIVIANLAAGRPVEAMERALELNRRATTMTIYPATRLALLLAMGHRALDLGDDGAAATLYSGAVAMLRASGVRGDPVDLLGETILAERLDREAAPSVIEDGRAQARRIDWEPWLQAMVEAQAAEVLAQSGIPFRELFMA